MEYYKKTVDYETDTWRIYEKMYLFHKESSLFCLYKIFIYQVYIRELIICCRYSLGVIFSHLRKVEQKLLSLLNPELKAISLTGMSGSFSRNFAELSLVAIRY